MNCTHGQCSPVNGLCVCQEVSVVCVVEVWYVIYSVSTLVVLY